MVRLAAVLVAAVLLVPSVADADQPCDELRRYRDGELFRSWELALERKRVFEEAKADAKRFAREVIQEAKQTNDLMLYRKEICQ
jgi:hypothetical protein